MYHRRGGSTAVTLSCLETGAFHITLRVKSAFFVDRSPHALFKKEEGDTQRLRGLFPQPKDVRRCLY